MVVVRRQLLCIPFYLYIRPWSSSCWRKSILLLKKLKKYKELFSVIDYLGAMFKRFWRLELYCQGNLKETITVFWLLPLEMRLGLQLVIAVLWVCHFSLCFCQLQGPPGVSGFPGNPGLPVCMKYFYKELQSSNCGIWAGLLLILLISLLPFHVGHSWTRWPSWSTWHSRM